MKNDDTGAPPEGSAYPEPTEAMRLAFTATRGSWFDKMRAALAVAAVGGVPAERHVRHLKRGSVYAVLGAATAQVSCGTVPASGGTTAGRILRDDATVVVYVGADGRLWVRFPDEMNDGRFETTQPGEFRRSDDHMARSSALIPAAVEVVCANRSYLEANPHAARHPDALTMAIERLEKEILR